MSKEKDIDMGGGTFARPGRRRKHLKPYTTLYESNFRDIPRTLRNIAKQIENKEIAQPNEGALILDCADGEYKVFGFGPHQSGINGTIVLCEIGSAELIHTLYKGKQYQAENYKPEPPK